MSHKISKNKEVVVVKSKLKTLAYKPEVQKTDLIIVNETRQNSHIVHVLICHNIRMRFGFCSLLVIL